MNMLAPTCSDTSRQKHRQRHHRELEEGLRHPAGALRSGEQASHRASRCPRLPDSPSPSCSPRNLAKLGSPTPAAAIAMKNNMNGTESPSLSPASTLSASRTRIGTSGLLTMTWPSPASVGARMADRMPASHSESCGKTSFAATAPNRIVSSIPTLNNRAGSSADVAENLQIRAARVGEQQQHQPDFRQRQEIRRMDPRGRRSQRGEHAHRRPT